MKNSWNSLVLPFVRCVSAIIAQASPNGTKARRNSNTPSTILGIIAGILLASLIPFPAQAQVYTNAGSYADQNNPMGPSAANLWSLDKSSGAVSIHIPFWTTPTGGRGPRIPYVMEYNSNSTIVLSGPFITWGNNMGPAEVPDPTAWANFFWESQSTETQTINKQNQPQPVGPWISVNGPSLSWDTDSNSVTAGGVNEWFYGGCTHSGPFLFSDSDGQIHDLNLALSIVSAQNPATENCSLSPNQTSAESSDGSALSSKITGENTGWCQGCYGVLGTIQPIIAPDGTSYLPTDGNVADKAPAISKIKDGNGNIAKTVSGAWQDSVGRTTATSPFGIGAQDVGSPGTYTVSTTGPTGQPEDYIITVETKSPTWSFWPLPHPTPSDLFVVGSYGNLPAASNQLGTLNVVTSISLLNNSSYSFDYDSVYGTISHIYLPTGGNIHFVWGIRSIGSRSANSLSPVQVYAQSTIVATDVYVSDGSMISHWQYSYPDMNTTTGALTTIETAPDGIQTTYTYMPYNTNPLFPATKNEYLEIQRTVGSTESVSTVYGVPPFPTLVATTMYDGSSPLQRQIQYAYDTHGNVIEKDESDWYGCSGSPASPCPAASAPPTGWLRQTFTQYAYQTAYGTNAATEQPALSAAHVVDKPSQILVTGGSGSQCSLVQYGYDESALAGGAGYLNHDDTLFPATVTLGRGNLTSETHCATMSTCPTTGANAASACSQWLPATKHTYDLAGQMRSTTDPNQNPATTFSYADTGLVGGTPPGTTDGFVTTVGHPGGFTDTYTYYYYTGQVASHTGWNTNETTGYTYDSMGRVTGITYPDTGQTSYCFTDVGGSIPNCTQGAAPYSTYKSVIATPSPTIMSSVTSDGLGRKVVETLPNGALVKTIYDSMGRMAAVSNPYFSGAPTISYTTYAYDALGRLRYKCNQDNGNGSGTCVPGTSYQQWSYSGSMVTFTDERSNSWKRTTDGLGQLIQVAEPTGAKTYYTYGALGNLTCVAQDGGTGGNFTSCASASASWRPRSFTYDSMSRLITATNPETGTSSYSYDANGNVQSKTSPAVNATSGTQTIGYCYDSLNRVTFKLNVAPTSTICSSPGVGQILSAFAYDTSSVNRAQNDAGRLTDEKSYAGSTLVSERQPYAYDAMGRLLNENQYTLGASTPYTPAYQYDLAGDLIASTDGADADPVT